MNRLVAQLKHFTNQPASNLSSNWLTSNQLVGLLKATHKLPNTYRAVKQEKIIILEVPVYLLVNRNCILKISKSLGPQAALQLRTNNSAWSSCFPLVTF